MDSNHNRLWNRRPFATLTVNASVLLTLAAGALAFLAVLVALGWAGQLDLAQMAHAAHYWHGARPEFPSALWLVGAGAGLVVSGVLALIVRRAEVVL